ncbi:MAG: hypothetical protein KAH31_11175 [Candidatus Sabulitectum sp.]|nr:hypothetical protein [Candidatus Sabulitectum sp.]
MNKPGTLVAIPVLLTAIVIFSSCGRKDPVPELHLVPGTALLHIHMEPGLSSSLTSVAGEFFSGFVLADSLLKKGPIGVTLVGIDISTLEPQLLLLTQDATTEYLTALSARVLDLDPRQEADRVDLVSEHGYAKASVTQRDGWTAVYIGPAPHITLGNWLEMKKENSLAADTSLAKVIPEEQHITILFPGNLFGFVSLLPLERQIPWWADYKDLALTVKPAAMSIFLSWPEPDTGEPVRTGMILARRGGGVGLLEVSVSDSHIDTDSCFILLMELAGWSVFNE